MLKKLLYCTDPSLNYDLLSQYSLVFQLGDQFLGCILFQPADKTVAYLSFQEIAGSKLTGEDVIAFLHENSWLKEPFQQVAAVSYSTRQMLVPVELFDAADPSFFADLQFGLRNQELLLTNETAGIEAVSLLSVPQDIYTVLNERFKNIQWSHWHEHIVSAVAGEQARITLSFFLNTFSLAIEKKGNWQLVQTYKYNTPEDVLYFVLQSFKQYDIDASLCQVQVDGLVNQDSAMIQLLYQYIPHLEWAQQLQFEYPPTADPTPVHTFALTDRILTCVS